jgi:putative endonuclease
MLDPSQRREDGFDGERRAEGYLRARGFRLVAANFLTRVGEIDLIMEDGDTLVFIEVKRRRNERYGEPEQSVTPGKIRRILKAALVFLHRHGIQDRMIRFDVVILDGDVIRHLPNAFDAGAWHPV